jgi:hypothetical protein
LKEEMLEEDAQTNGNQEKPANEFHPFSKTSPEITATEKTNGREEKCHHPDDQ